MRALGKDATRGRPAARRGALGAARLGTAAISAAAIALWLVLAPGAAGQGPPRRPTLDPALAQRLSQTGDLTLNDAPLGESLLRVSEIWGVNLIAGVELKGRVTGAFKDAPLHEILDAVLLSNGYSYRPVGSSLVILKLEDVGNVNAMFETAAIPLRYAEPKECVESLKLLASPRGKVQAIESARVVLVSDFPEQVATIRRFVDEMDAAAAAAKSAGGGKLPPANQVAQFKPQHVQAAALKDSLQAVLSQTGKLGIVATENRLVVADLPPNLDLARKVVEQLDVPRPQVRITALIYDVSLKDMEQLGINWNAAVKMAHDASGNPSTVLSLDSVTQAAITPGDPAGVLTFMNLSRKLDLTAVVQALQQCSDSRLLANPNVTVLENEPATIAIVTEIPYQQLTQTQQGGNIGTTAFREAGVKLEVTPMIAEDGTIQMIVTPSFSRLTGYTPGDQPQPIIDRREAKTSVRVANLQTLVIGGLRQRSDIGEYTGIPFLKDIRWIGFLFRSRSTTIRESELLVFIRPEIVGADYGGYPREHAAATLTDCLLDGIPVEQSGCACRVRRLPPVCEEHGPCGQPGPAARAAPKPSAWERLFGSKRHPDGWVMEQRPMREPYDNRFGGGPAAGTEGQAAGGGSGLGP